MTAARTPGVYLRAPTTQDRAAFLAAVAASRRLHRPWITAPATAAQFRAYVVRTAQANNRAFNRSNVIMGPFRSGCLGYYAFADRLEANIQPGNEPSIALARACGFSREGFSPRYLKIGGRWRDHERWAILSS